MGCGDSVKALGINSGANKLDPLKYLTSSHFLGTSSPSSDVGNSNRTAAPVFFGTCQVNGTALNEQQLEQLTAVELKGSGCCG